MNLMQRVSKDWKSFEDTIFGIMDDGSYDPEFSLMLLQIKCKTIRMEIEIAMALNLEPKTRRLLELYQMKIGKCLDSIKENQCFANDLQLEKLDVVYGKLFHLRRFIGELFV